MKTLIIYASKYGFTADCAKALEEKLPGEITRIDIDKPDQGLDLEQFDAIVIGASVYIGKISKRVRAFCEENLNLLLRKRIGIFLCCGLVDQVGEALTGNFPAALLAHASSVQVFGGEARPEKMGFADKLILKAASKATGGGFQVLDENMDVFVREITA